MTVLDHSPRTAQHETWSPRLQRRHEIVTTGGIQGILDIGTALRACGFPVPELTVEVRDGVQYSSVVCTVALTAAECAPFVDRLAALPAVVSVEPC